MKLVFNFFKSAIVIAVPIIMLLTFCSKEDDPLQTEKDRVMTLLQAHTWKIKSVTVDNTDETNFFQDMTMTFADGSYNTTNGGVVWSANGNFTFVDDSAKSFVREDGIVVTIDNITEDSLTLSFNWTKTTLAGGRASSIAGKTSFVFTNG